MPPILLLLWSKITVDLVKKLDLVKVLVPPKNFTKSGLYCISLEAETEKGVVSLIIFRALLEVLANLSTKLAEIWDI